MSIAETVKPDLVITDALLPKLDGRELCQRLKNNPDTRTRVIVMTGLYKGPRYRHEAIGQFSVDEFLEKPIAAEKLRVVVERMLNMTIPPAGHREPGSVRPLAQH